MPTDIDIVNSDIADYAKKSGELAERMCSIVPSWNPRTQRALRSLVCTSQSVLVAAIGNDIEKLRFFHADISRKLISANRERPDWGIRNPGAFQVYCGILAQMGRLLAGRLASVTLDDDDPNVNFERMALSY